MSYHYDSDIVWPNGWVNDLNDPSFYVDKIETWRDYQEDWQKSNELRVMVKEKSKKVSWLISNCSDTHSHRERYVG